MNRSWLWMGFFFFFYGCGLFQKDEPKTKPLLTTKDVSSITSTSALSGGDITSDGGSPVNSRGVVWSTSSFPTIDLPTKTNDGAGTGTFETEIANLIPNTRYFVRAYASNEVGTSYGNEVNFETIPGLAEVNIAPIADITSSTASGGGEVITDNGSPVTARGLAWQTSSGPTLESNLSTNGSGTGVFSSSLNGLEPGTMYYVRAYATNGIGTAYSNEINFTTEATFASSTALSIDKITSTTCMISIEVTADGGAEVTERGLVWNTSPLPTIDLPTKSNEGMGTGSFTGLLTELAPNQKYYVRAFATNSVGTSYSNQLNFITKNVDDIDGNGYYTITIGTQVWFAENLRTTKYDDGTLIPLVTDPAAWPALSGPAYSYYEQDESLEKIYGKLYNWFAINGTSNGGRNICPVGWHVPSNDELNTLKTFLGNDYTLGYKLQEIGTEHWYYDNITHENDATNSSGFTGLPGGRIINEYTGINYEAWWWSSTQFDTDSAYNLNIVEAPFFIGGYAAYISNNNKTEGFSIRCIKD